MTKQNSHATDELELMAYLDGELSRDRAAAAAAHLETCAECKTLADELRGVSQELTGWQVETSDAQLTARLCVALEDHERVQRNKTRRDAGTPLPTWSRRRIWTLALAGITLALIASVSVFMLSPHAHAPSAEVSQLWRRQNFDKLGSSTGSAESLTVGGVDTENAFVIGPQHAPPQNQSLAGRAGHAAKIPEKPLPSGPMVIRTAELALTTTDFEHSRTRIEEILKRHSGYLGDLNITGDTNAARTLTATLRVPSDQLDATIAELRSLGKVESESQKGEEVSQQYIDLQARLLNARNSEQRLTELLRRAGKLSDVLAVEEQIESVRENIETMDAERKNLAKQVAFSSLNMKISEDYKEKVQVVPDSASTRFRNAAVEGYETMVAGLINLLLFLVSWGPSFLLWGAILFFPGRWLWRNRRRNLF
jgi:hypothetical protein